MDDLQQKRLKGRQVLLESLGYNVNEKTLSFNDGECSICLKSIDKDRRPHDERSPSGRLILPCGHVFHYECICIWANFKNENLKQDVILPARDRRISYFKEGQNVFSCPTCRHEFTRDVFDGMKIKKVIAKIHALYKGDECIHYITDPLEPIAYIPKSELTEEGKIAVRWGYYIETLNKLWRAGHTNVWAVKEEDGHFLLRSDYKRFDRITKEGKKINGKPPTAEVINLDELQELLNDVK